MDEIPDDVEFIDAEGQFNSKEGITFKNIILNHLSKMSILCTKEFMKGYWEKKPFATSGGTYMIEVYKTDTRLAYINAVDFFEDMLLPKFDEEIEGAMVKINDEMEITKAKGLDKDDWIDEKLILKRKVFRELSQLLKRLDYLEVGQIG